MSFLLGLVLFLPQADAPASPEVPLPSGVWRAWLDSPGGELPFGLELQHDQDGLRAWLVNGSDRTPASVARVSDATVTFEWGDFDSVLRARVTTGGTALDGTWDKQTAGNKRVELGFHARFNDSGSIPAMPMLPPALPNANTDANADEPSTGRYKVLFDGDEHPAVGLLHQAADGTLEGTFLTALGDYRFLSGRRERNGLMLACFDGGHAFLFRAEADGDGTLRGRFWSGASPAQTWTAVRDNRAALPDAYKLTQSKQRKVGNLAFPDLDGEKRSLTDPELLGRASLILLFGSWCPNCHDAAETLVQLHRRYRDRGLRVVGLAFELTDDAARNERVLRAYAARHQVQWPILLAGPADKKLAARALPFLDRVVAYPTVLFVGNDGTIAAIHTGFTGPAAPAEHQELVLEWRARIEDLLR